jgi:hypothetical protein
MKASERTRLFLDDADRLADSPYLAEALKAGRFSRFQISWTRETGVTTMTAEEPAPDALDVLLVRLRPYLLQGEPTNLDSMHNLGHRLIRSDELRGHLIDIRAQWRKRQRDSGMGLKINELDMPPSRAAELLLYGSGLFHRNRYDEWATLGVGGQVLTRAVFMHWLNDAIWTVLATADVFLTALRADMIEEED